jgi:Pvc16 N-terminal domain
MPAHNRIVSRRPANTIATIHKGGPLGSAFAIASVTALIKRLLENGLVTSGVPASVGGEVAVTAIAPDRIVTGNDERPQINLFLYQATPNTGLRGRPAGLALDLHYLIAVYGAQDLQTDILLGYTIQQLQQHSTLDADAIRSVLHSSASPDDGTFLAPALAALGADVSAHLAQLALTPQFLSSEELSRLWSALQARYRPSMIYRASVAILG